MLQKQVHLKTTGIIPARFQSSRFPGKPLVKIAGKSMIQRVFEQASQAQHLTDVIVATDDLRIFQHVLDFGGKAEMTDTAHRSGTDRCAEVASRYQDIEAIVNIQGDEPFISPTQINQLVLLLNDSPENQIATLRRKIQDKTLLFNQNTVKLTINQMQQALYFSRLPIPFCVQENRENWLKKGTYWQHLGIYAFRRKTLLAITQLPTSDLERRESLEQLRWLEHGYQIRTAETTLPSFSIDTPEDLQRVREHFSLSID